MEVLIAEDDPVQRHLLETVLRKSGYEVVSVANGADAIASLRDLTVQLAVIDWQMPEKDGLEVCAHLKDLQRFVYAILLTADQSADLMARALQAGASDFARKPFRQNELLARLRVGERIARLQLQLVHLQKLEGLGRLAGGMAHEINTPMQFIGDNVRFLRAAVEPFQTLYDAYRLLLDHGDDSKCRAQACSMIDRPSLDLYLEEIPQAITQSLEGVDRVSRMVSALKEFSNPASEGTTTIDLNHCLENAIVVAQNEWRWVAELETDLAAGLPEVAGHPGDLHQVFLNLLVNAAQAIAARPVGSGTKGKIVARSRQDGDWVEVAIKDDGIGIPPEARSRVFDPFFTTRPVGNGTGQGLAIAHAIVVGKQGGSIRFETEPGRGTEFIVRLPAAPQRH